MKERILALLRRCGEHLAAGTELIDTDLALSRAQKLWLFCAETGRAVARHQTFTLASALAFKTLLSIVPLILIGMAVSMTLGTENGVSYADGFLNAIEKHIPQVPALQPLLDLLRDLARRPREIAGIGFIMLFYTAYSLLASVDWCCNYIWQVETRRSLLNRLVSYFLIIVIVPILMSLSVVANSEIAAFFDLIAGQVDSLRASFLTGSAAAAPAAAGTGWIVRAALGALSCLITCAALAILIKLMPNTRVKFSAAAFGGLAGGLLIELTRYCFGLYTNHAAENLTRLYGSTLLFIPLTLLWLWISWAFVLLGAEAAFAAQNYHTLALQAKINKNGLRSRIYIGLRLLVLVAADFARGDTPRPLSEAAAEQMHVPPFMVQAVAADLCAAGLLREVAEAQECYLPGKDIGALTVADITRALNRDELSVLPEPADPAAARINAAFSAVATCSRRELDNLTIKELANLMEKN